MCQALFYVFAILKLIYLHNKPVKQILLLSPFYISLGSAFRFIAIQI